MSVYEAQLSKTLEVLSVLRDRDVGSFNSYWTNEAGDNTLSVDVCDGCIIDTSGIPEQVDQRLISMVGSRRENMRGDMDPLYVYLPFSVGHLGDNITVLVISHANLETKFSGFFGDSFTSSEIRLMAQLLIGMSLVEAAEADQVTRETKKFHLKSVFLKTFTTRQPDLVRLLLSSALTTISQSSDSSGDKNSTFWHYCQTYFGDDVRPKVMLDKNGFQHRILDMGPISGSPKIMFHPQVLPSFSTENFAYLRDQSIRLIWPLRNGALGPNDDIVRFRKHLEIARAGIDAAVSILDERPHTFVGLISGCHYLIDYLSHRAQATSTFVMVGPPVDPVRNATSAGRLRNGLFGLANSNQKLALALLNFMNRKVEDIDRFRDLLSDIYGICEADAAVINDEFETCDYGRDIQFRFRNSIPSIQHDFFAQARPNWNLLAKAQANFHIIHGQDDQIHKVEGLKRFDDLPQYRGFEAIEGAGQFLYLKHFEAVMSRVKNLTG